MKSRCIGGFYGCEVSQAFRQSENLPMLAEMGKFFPKLLAARARKHLKDHRPNAFPFCNAGRRMRAVRPSPCVVARPN
jgi:hypothetical protein